MHTSADLETAQARSPQAAAQQAQGLVELHAPYLDGVLCLTMDAHTLSGEMALSLTMN